MTKELNDRLDDIFGLSDETPAVRPVITAARKVPSYKPAEQRFEEGCPKCRGTGRFTSWSGRQLGECFACKGKGSKTFKSSPEARAKARMMVSDRKIVRELEGVAAWKEVNPAEYAWLEKTAQRWDLAQSLLDGLKKYGSLTEKQMAIVHNGMARDAAFAEKRAQKPVGVALESSEGVDKLKAAFDVAIAKAAEKGLKKKPKITAHGMTISPAPASGKNPNALYVKGSGNGDVYLGKIEGSRFFPSRECSPNAQVTVMKFVADPQEASKVYGQETGTCCICNATLKSEWRLKGIGPICAEKFGWGL